MTIFFVLFFILLLMNIPIIFTMGICSIYYLIINNESIIILTQRFFAGSDSFSLMAIPLFIFAGEIMNGCGVTKRIFKFANSLVGFIPGSLAHVNVLASTMFAGISGSTTADVASLGVMEIGGMVDAGFDRSYSTAITASSATIGSIIPPSILMVLYSSITGISCGKLFIAGVIPGLTVAISQMIYAVYKAKKNPEKYDTNNKIEFSKTELLNSFVDAIPALIMPIIIVGGTLSGVFTATESGAIACVYGLIIGIFVYKEFNLKKTINAIIGSCKISGMTMLIVASATCFGYCLAIERFPLHVSQWILGVSANANIVMLLMIVCMLVIGCFMDTTSAAIIMVPIFQPIAASFGIDGIQFGMVMILTFIMGGITPPVGITLYVASAVGKIKLEKLLKEMYPFIGLFLIVLIITAYVPGFSLFLPSLFS